MRHEWEENAEIQMTGRGGKDREAPIRNTQSYFSPPTLDSKDKQQWKSKGSDVNTMSDHCNNIVNRMEDKEKGYSRKTGGKPAKDNKKCIAMIATVGVLILVILFWPCNHMWSEATCTSERVCGKCGKVEGTALGHNWEKATCTSPSKCTRCNETSGVALGHNWGELAEPDYVEAKVVTYSLCDSCGKKEAKSTDALTTLLSDDGKTFHIAPEQYAERVKNICSTMLGTDRIDCKWMSRTDIGDLPGVELVNGTETLAVILFYDEEGICLSTTDKNKESVLDKVAVVFYRTDKIADYVAAGVVMASNPELDGNDAETILYGISWGDDVFCDGIVYRLDAANALMLLDSIGEYS